MTKMFYAEWENVNEDSENYEEYDTATFSTLAEAREWLGDRLESYEYDCTVLVENEKKPGWFKIALKGWLP